ncbi:A nuclease of the HNH/ENDO VII superfamily with conserved LHH [Zobellia uliginosa]|uniref:A nuclease of the HNH/ENDO VII superfamily with conserved LHH n=2 Tax=Zobellia uliginosa TaxID=143224 RepID=A0ABY1L032_9FLAO|nr:A nuclease of the HNH/ENDO VII superfamily with conserved LHH [Zobellia uliginosa]
MVELTTSFHKTHHKPLHSIIEDGASFRNNQKLEYQYNKYRKKYWIEKLKDFIR